MDLNYNQGKLDGLQLGFDKDGNLSEKAEYSEGQLVKKIK
jgi:antitoxin component YwqK of YwqJK toxin-antitoxin module